MPRRPTRTPRTRLSPACGACRPASRRCDPVRPVRPRLPPTLSPTSACPTRWSPTPAGRVAPPRRRRCGLCRHRKRRGGGEGCPGRQRRVHPRTVASRHKSLGMDRDAKSRRRPRPTGQRDAPRLNVPPQDTLRAEVRALSVARTPLRRVRQPVAAPVRHRRAAPGRFGGRLRRAGCRPECAVELWGASERPRRPCPPMCQRRRRNHLIRLAAPRHHRQRPSRCPVLPRTRPVDTATGAAQPRGCVAARSLSSNHHRGLLGRARHPQHRRQRQ